MIIDADVKLGKSFKRTAFMAEDYIDEMEKNGIDKAVIMAEKPISYDISEGNDYIEEVLGKYPEKFLGAVRVDPWDEAKAVSEMKRRFKNPMFKAIYLNPWEENYRINSDIVRPVLELTEKLGKSVIIEGGYVWVSHVTQVADIAKDFPNVKFMMTTAGQMDLSGYSLTDVKYFMARIPNLYMGSAAAVAAEWTVEMYRKEAPGRIIFETNYPFFEVKLEKARIELNFFSDEEKREVSCKNAESFFGI